MKLEMSVFNGIKPKTDAKLLPEGQAQEAHNVDLRSGNLRPLREPLTLSDEFDGLSVGSVYRHHYPTRRLECGTSGAHVAFQSVSNGSFKMKIANQKVNVAGLNFTSCATPSSAAAVIQSAVRAIVEDVDGNRIYPDFTSVSHDGSKFVFESCNEISDIGSYETEVSIEESLTAKCGSYRGCVVYQLIPAAKKAGRGKYGNRIRLTFQAHPEADLQLSSVLVDGTPATFSGFASATVPAGTQLASDWIALGYIAGSNHIVAMDFGNSGISTSFSHALDGDSLALNGFSVRQIIAASELGVSGKHVRLKLRASSSSACVLSHAAIAPRAGSKCNASRTPSEFLFAGGQGVSIPAGSFVWTDWLDLGSGTLDEGSDHVLILDVASGALRTSGSGSGAYAQDSSTTWDLPTVSSQYSFRSELFTANGSYAAYGSEGATGTASLSGMLFGLESIQVSSSGSYAMGNTYGLGYGHSIRKSADSGVEDMSSDGSLIAIAKIEVDRSGVDISGAGYLNGSGVPPLDGDHEEWLHWACKGIRPARSPVGADQYARIYWSEAGKLKTLGTFGRRDVKLPKPSRISGIAMEDLYKPEDVSAVWMAPGCGSQVLKRQGLEETEKGFVARFHFAAQSNFLSSAINLNEVKLPDPKVLVSVPGIGVQLSAPNGLRKSLGSDGVKWGEVEFRGVSGVNTNVKLCSAYTSMRSVSGAPREQPSDTSNGTYWRVWKSATAVYLNLVVIDLSGMEMPLALGPMDCSGGNPADAVKAAIDEALGENNIVVSDGIKGPMYFSVDEKAELITHAGFTDELTGSMTSYFSPNCQLLHKDGDILVDGNYAYGVVSGRKTVISWPEAEFAASWSIGYKFSRGITRYYRTSVNDLGEESEASDASVEIDRQPDRKVTLALEPIVEANSIQQRIYRVDGSGQVRLVDELDASATRYVDWKTDSELGEELVAKQSPPDGLKGLVNIGNGMLAAFMGRDIWISDEYNPTSWRLENILSASSAVMALVPTGGETAVLTEGEPFLLYGESAEGISLSQGGLGPYPCLSALGAVAAKGMAIYPSCEGLVGIDGGQARLLTGDYMRREDWQAWAPSRIEAAFSEGRYYGFSNGVQFIVDFDEGRGLLITTHDVEANCVSADAENDGLYIVQGGLVRLFGGGEAALSFKWRGREEQFKRPAVWNSLRICGQSGVSCAASFYAEGAKALELQVQDGNSRRIPILRPERRWSLEIESSLPVDSVELCSSVGELIGMRS